MKKLLATIMLMLPLVIEAMNDQLVEMDDVQYVVTLDNLKILRRVIYPKTKLNIRSDVCTIGKRCARYRQSLKEVVFGKDTRLQRIEKEAFFCAHLRRICIPSSVEVIGEGGFFNCAELSDVTFEPGSKLQKMEAWTFFSCASLQRIRIPSSVEVIGDRCFATCISLIDVTFEPNSKLQRIGEAAFGGAVQLDGITIPSGVKYIDRWCFHGCKSLRSVTFEINSQQLEIGEETFPRGVSLENLPQIVDSHSIIESIPVDSETYDSE
jgi:hypothetical protein